MIQKGATVRMHYTLKVDGEQVETSKGGQPLQYVHGAGQILPGLEAQIEGMGPGETRTVRLKAGDAYGEHDPEAVKKMPTSAFQAPEECSVGDVVSGKVQGHEFQATVLTVDKDGITLDFNHPLAGKELEFEIEVVDVEAPQS